MHAEDAASALRSALELDPAIPRARHELGKAAFRAGDLTLALVAFGQSREVDELTEDLYWIGRCAYAMGRLGQAERFLGRAIDERETFLLVEDDEGGVADPEWRHWLGRTLWRNGQREQGLRLLRASFDPAQPELTEGLFVAHLDREDPHAALRVAEAVGRAGATEAARGLVDRVLERWPTPRGEDLHAGRPPHTYVATRLAADLAYRDRRWCTAAEYFGRLGAPPELRDAARQPWATLRCGRSREAVELFREYRDARERGAPGRYTLGLGAALLTDGQRDAAATMLGSLEDERWEADRDTGLLWSSADGAADGYTLLGLIQEPGDPSRTRGLYISAVLPGGALAAARPRVQPGDRLVRVGDWILTSDNVVAAFRREPVPGAPVTAEVIRGAEAFEVELDYAAARRALEASG